MDKKGNKNTHRKPTTQTWASRLPLLLAVLFLCLAGCYQPHPTIRKAPAAMKFSERQIDSLSFFSTHHYTNNYNFVVRGDSLALIRQMPDEYLSGMPTDTFWVYRDAHVVVADIRTIPTDSIDSVWVELANDTSAFGWTRESTMLPQVMPDDPISQFISTFSSTHVIIFLGLLVVFVSSYLLWNLTRRRARIVHFNDIDSFYPTLLCLTVAASATLYATLQTCAPEMWEHFYFHPTLNPFSVPLPLGVFLISVWSILVVAIAAFDDVRHQLPAGEAILYLLGLAAVCAIDYLVFSITALYKVGYLLLALYLFFAIRQYMRHHRAHYICGNCGAKLHHKGRCPFCGAMNE